MYIRKTTTKEPSNTTPTVSFPFFSILAIVFITLKLLKIITWSWLWVLAPIWAPLITVIIIALLAFILAMIAATGDK